MAQEIQVDASLPSVPLIVRGSGKKSDEALAASFQKLEELLNVVAKDEISAKTTINEGAKESTVSSAESILNGIDVSSIKSMDDFMAVIETIAPSIQAEGKEVSEQMAKAGGAFLQYQEAMKSVDPRTFEADSREILLPAFGNKEASVTALLGLYDDVSPLLEKLNARDPSRFQAFGVRLAPVLGLIALRNPAKAKEILGDFSDTLESVYDQDDEHQGKFFAKLESGLKTVSSESDDPSVGRLLSSYSSNGTQNSPDMSGSLGLAMLFLQQFQVALTKCQADQGTNEATISTFLVQAAMDAQVNVAKEISAAAAAAKAAADRPWWEKLIQGIVEGVGIAVSLIAVVVSGGAATPLIALAVTVFMATPAFNDAVQGIASHIPGPLGQLLGTIIMTVIVCAVSFGVGGFGAAAEGAAEVGAEAATGETVETTVNAAAEEAVDVAADTTTETVENTVTKSSKYGSWSGVRGGKMALFQGVSTLTSSGFVMDCMSMDPSFLKNHPKLAMWLNIASEAVGMLLTSYLGYKAFSGASVSDTTDSPFLEKLTASLKGLVPASWAMQTGQAGMEIGLGVQRVGFLKEQSSITEKLGEVEAQMTTYLSAVDMTSDSLNVNNSSASSITKMVAEEMDTLENASGSIWKTTARLAAS